MILCLVARSFPSDTGRVCPMDTGQVCPMYTGQVCPMYTGQVCPNAVLGGYSGLWLVSVGGGCAMYRTLSVLASSPL